MFSQNKIKLPYFIFQISFASKVKINHLLTILEKNNAIKKRKFLVAPLKVIRLGYYETFYGHSIAQNRSEGPKGGVSL